MKYNELKVDSAKSKTRVGRGISAGKGKTAGRGTKGQNARTGGGVRPGFEGGQNPLAQRLPKLRGFRSIRTAAETIYTGQLNELSGKITNQSLYDAGLITTPYGSVKVVVQGELSKKLDVSLQGASKQAEAMIKKAGGSFTRVLRPQRKTKQSKPKTTTK